MNLRKFFDPYNKDHIAAYAFNCKEGYWPEWFINYMEANDIFYYDVYSYDVERKIIDAWVNYCYNQMDDLI